MRKGLVLVLFLAAQLAQAACDPADEHIVLRIQDFATAYFRDFTVDMAVPRRVRQRRVRSCSDESWTVRRAYRRHRAACGPARGCTPVTLDPPNWQISADSLTSDGEEFLVQGGFRGTVSAAPSRC